MTLGLCLIGVACLGWAVAAIAARPPTAEVNRRDDRRFRRVYRNPELVNLLDIENLLLADAVYPETITRVMRRADSHRISARTMWRWADQHGSARLVDALDAGLSEDTMLDHLDAGTAPEWHSISVFADLADHELPAGMPLDELVDLDAVPTLSELTFAINLDDWETHRVVDDELAGFDALPPITDPGFGPFSPAEALREAAAAEAAAAVEAPEPAAEKPREDGADWPAVA